MKLVHRNFEKDGVGSITLVPEETEDMWHAYNLIAEGDSVRASTIRKVGAVWGLESSVPDPNPDPYGPYVFGPPGSAFGSIRQRYGSGSIQKFHD
jgi:hypothetical protein